MPHSLRCAHRCLGLLLSTLTFFTLPAVGQSTTGTFVISAGSIAITPTGSGAIPFTLTSVDGFSGSVMVQCEAPVVPAGVNIPICGGGPIRLYTLTSGQALTGSIELYSDRVPVPASLAPSSNPAFAIFIAIALLSGLTVRRRSAHRLRLPLLLAGLALVSCISGCGTGPQGFTPGTYTYTVTATQSGSVNPLTEGAHATVSIH